MKRFGVAFLLSLIGFLATNSMYAQAFPGLSYGGSANDAAFSFCVMPDGGYTITGLTRSYGAGSTDLYVLRIDRYGKLKWSRTFGIEVQEQAFWVEATEDGGVFLTGYCTYHPGSHGRQDFYMLKLDAGGSLDWQTFSGGGLLDVGLCGKPVPGGFVAVGISRDGDTFGNYYLVRLDAEGNEVWHRIFDSPYVDYGHEFQRLPNGDFLLFGTESGFLFPSELDHHKPHSDLMLIKTDSSGNEIWRKIFGGKRHDFGKSIKPAPDGGFYLFGSTQNQGAGSFDMWLLKINDDGDTLWSKTWGGSNWDYGNSMDVDADGNLYLIGTTTTLGSTGSPDILVVKTDGDGNQLWMKTFGGDSADYGTFIRALPTGGCAFTGHSRSKGAGGRDVYFSVLSEKGETVGYLMNGGELPYTLVFPNPVIDASEIRIPSDYYAQPLEWRVYDLNGRTIATKVLETGVVPTISKEDFPVGTYLYELVQRGKMVLKGKFLVR